MNDINELRRLALDGDLAAMQEIILRLEAAEKSDAESLAMYRKARDERDALRVDRTTLQQMVYSLKDRLEAAEKERDSARKLADSLALALNTSNHERDALRARIEAMERQEPAWFIDERGEPKRYHKRMADYCKCGGLDLLYALPGAKGK